MLDSLFRQETEQIVRDRIDRPLPEPVARPSFGLSVWNTTKAPFVGAGVGIGLEAPAHGADLLGAFGSTVAGYGSLTDPSLLFSQDEQRKRIEAGQKARDDLASGAAFSTEIGTGLRATARSFAPDSATANAAEQILFGLGRFGGKAVGYSLLAGPVAGAAMLGSDEGMVEADRLAAEGVDPTTRTKAGIAAAASAALSVALPVAGRTLPQTAALVAAGGPGAFIAQQAATRAILENAGYDKIAAQYDPFDPVGLAVSTLVPAGFGALAMRGARTALPTSPTPDAAAARALHQMGGNERLALKYDDPRLDAYAVTAAQREGIPPEALLAIKNVGERSGPTAVSPKGAQGVMQFMPDTWTAYGKGDPRDPVASIDAGARMMADLIKQYGGDVRAAIAHYNGGGKAGQAVREGRLPPAAETRKYLERTDAYLAERQGTEVGRTAANDPDAVAAARVALVKQTVESWNLKDPADVAGAQQHLTAFLRASDQLSAGDAVSITSSISLDTLGQARMFDDMVSRLEAARADLLPDAGNALEPGAVRALRDEIAQIEQARPAASDEAVKALAKEIQTAQGISYKAALSAAKKDISTRVADTDARIARLEEQLRTNRRASEAREQVQTLDRQIERVKADRGEVAAPTPKPVALAVKQAVSDMPGKVAQAGKAVVETRPADLPAAAGQAPARAAAEPKAGAGGPALSGLDTQAAEIARLSPDMMVQLEGMEAPMRLADALEAVKAEAAREAQDAPLLQVAAECALRNG